MSEPTLQDCINYMRSQIKQMEKHPRNYEFNLPYYRKTVELLEKADRPHGEWISCSERLPSYSERIVLATVVRRDKTWNNEPYHRLVTYINGKWYPVPQSINLVPCHMATIEQSDGGQAEVLAWMPLPKPYQKEGEAE